MPLPARPTAADAGGTHETVVTAVDSDGNPTTTANVVDPGNGSIGNLNTAHPLPSTVQQIENYLATPGAADPNAIYMIGTGGNDNTLLTTR